MNKPQSNCCNAPLITNQSDEGTGYYSCSSCQKPCDQQNKPQLSAEMEKRFDEEFGMGGWWHSEKYFDSQNPEFKTVIVELNKSLKIFFKKHLSTIATKSAEIERNKVIEEVRELIAYSSFEMTPGGRPMKRTCSVEEAMRQLEKDVAKLNQLKEGK